MIFKGVNSPVITIMNEDGSIDYKNMEKHINRLVEAGLDGLLFFGSLGEFYAISMKEKKEFIDFAVKVVNRRTQVIIGVSGTSLEEVIELAQYSEKAGADAINVVSPYYFGLSAYSAIEFFGKVSESVTIPIMLYNFPDRTGSDLSPDVVCELAIKYKNIVGIKDTVDNISHTRALCQKIKPIRPDFSILSGFDEYYLVNRVSGGDGVLCGLTNLVPELFVELNEAYNKKDFDKVESCAKKIASLMQVYTQCDLFIVAMKYAVKYVSNLDMSTYTKLPGIAITTEQMDRIERVINDAIS